MAQKQQQNRKTRRTLEATKKKFIERTDCETGEDGVVYASFEAFDKVWTFPHPLFASDEWQASVDAAAETNIGKAQAVLGEQQWEQFQAAGGTASDVMIMFTDVQLTMQDEISGAGPTPPAGPTQS
ncbi:hypothetical protein [Streptomonospora litoralis]|uniref:Uncharacterized protein n=1 Tax=Streptomonospora litoralis TaxID=2498135 RepID=A0A4P6PZ61_9ACTN|nr:hypothetical protein [Streptomonospora litoralis]QBI53423.1 hypothetical protein EKD16_08145 [Streptomonospora litoralis]